MHADESVKAPDVNHDDVAIVMPCAIVFAADHWVQVLPWFDEPDRVPPSLPVTM